MIQGRSGSRLTHEPLHPVRVRRDIQRQNLQRHLTVEPRVVGEVDFSHAAGAQQRKNLVVTKLPTHQPSVRILGQGLRGYLDGRRLHEMHGLLLIDQ
jgi:hypothetical protein